MKRICASIAYSMPNPLTVNKKPQIKYIHLILENQGNRQEKKDPFYRTRKLKIKNVYLERTFDCPFFKYLIFPYLFGTGRFYEYNASETHTDHKKDKKENEDENVKKR